MAMLKSVMHLSNEIFMIQFMINSSTSKQLINYISDVKSKGKVKKQGLCIP